jgi:spoIIIJ-associated protein
VSDLAKKLEKEGDIAADFLEGLLDIADLDGDIDMDVDGDRAAVEIVGGNLDHLVGRDGEVLDALQELTRLDIAGFRAARRTELVAIAEGAIEKVKAGEPSVALDPMTPFERKVVHDAVADHGLSSSSEGVEPHRYVVVHTSAE